MKKSTLLIYITVVFCCCNLLSYSQDVNTRKFNPDQPVFFTPKNHDPNFLKSAKLSERSFYQRKSEWQHIIDSTWGPGAPLSEKLLIYNTYAKAIREKFDGFNSLKLNWDSLYNHYLTQITESTSKGAFSGIMSHFAYDLKDFHTKAYDSTVVYTPLNPGIPILFIGGYLSVEHFGVVTTILPDSTTLVLRVVPNHPLNLEPGDIILGYEGVPWKNLVRELLDAGLPMIATTGGCKTADTYHKLIGAGLNWHLFNTIDILKLGTGDTLHISVLPMMDLNASKLPNNEQLPIQNIPFPKVSPYPAINDTTVTYGILEGKNIGYIFLSSHWPTTTADEQFYNAINALKNTDALIIDMRLSYGGFALFDKAFNILFNDFHYTIQSAYRCNTNTFELCPIGSRNDYQINGKDPDYYDRPIAVLLGPSCVSMGDCNAYRLKFHPMVKFFGASSDASLGDNLFVENFPGWYIRYSIDDPFLVSEPGVYLNRKEFPIDYPVWFNKDDVAKGIDPIVEKSLSWINNLAYGHDVTIENGLFSPAGDTVTISAIVENPNSHELSAKLIFESMDGSIVDSTDMTIPNLAEVSKLQGKWKTPDTVENTYWVSVKVKDLADGSSFNNKHATRITTAGPVVLDSISIKKSSSSYLIKPFIKNESAVTSIKKPTVRIICTDPWVLPITKNIKDSREISPGQIETIGSPFQVKYIDSLFTGYFNFKFEISSDGWPYWTFDTTITIISTGIEQVKSLPQEYGIEQNYPNPFNSVTTIKWQLAKSSKVTLKVFDIVGRTVATLVDEQRPQGKYETQFNAAMLPKGIYFCQLKAGEFSQTRKMILLE